MHKLISLRGSRQAHIDFRFVIPARHTMIRLGPMYMYMYMYMVTYVIYVIYVIHVIYM